MIISRTHRFIFTRPLKVGSSSAQAMFINSGILTDEDSYSGYRDSVDSPTTSFKNVPPLTCKDVRRVSPYPIPASLLVDESGPLPLLGHVTPTEMVRLGLISQDELDTYTFVSIIRNPISRYLSAWFFDKTLQGEDKILSELCDDIYAGYIPHSFLGRGVQDYFTHEGKAIKNAVYLRTEALFEDINRFLEKFGYSVDQDHRLKANNKPEWACKHYSNYLPGKAIVTLHHILQSEIEFYQEKLLARLLPD